VGIENDQVQAIGNRTRHFHLRLKLSESSESSRSINNDVAGKLHTITTAWKDWTWIIDGAVGSLFVAFDFSFIYSQERQHFGK
jgi:hypothetical protein